MSATLVASAAAAEALRAGAGTDTTAAGAPYWSPQLSRSRRITTSPNMDNYDKQGCLHDMFVKQALLTPNATAVVTHNGQKMTFEELNKITDLLALRLRHLGVKRNTVVGILMDRCLEYTISYIAILKAGGAYMPVEVSYPQSLLQSVLQDAEPIAVCTKKLFRERLDNLLETNKIIVLENGWQKEIEHKYQPLSEPVEVGLDDMAYTVYSSGTTGKPKGIQCPHRGAVFSYHWRHVTYPYESDDHEACNVFFVWEMLRPLLKGIPLYIIPDDIIYDPPRLVAFLKEHKITRMLFTPSLLQAVLDFKDLNLKQAFQKMRQIWFCGEVVTTLLKERFSKLFPKIQLINLYSVSECHDIAVADLNKMNDNEKRKFCPVGKLLPGVHVVIMDEDQNIQPVGAPGEIYVGGPTLAIGYLNRPEVTAYRFIPRPEQVPAHVGSRLYRTGDWGYMLSDGNLEICGRCDSMVKIRGYSVELQAVETALLDLQMVNTGCVLALGDEGADKLLVAYIVPEEKASRKEVRAALKKKLPFYMIPSKFVFLNSIPILEASGKLDKKALPKIDANENDGIDPQDLPSTPMEHKIAKIWCGVLQLPAVDVQESFFDLGGHSLIATRLLSEMNETLKLNLVLADLFNHPNIQSLANFVEDPSMVNGENEHLDLEAEVDRHDQGKALMDIRLRAFWRSFQLSNKWRRDKVLLTGVTGYVGTFLLKELLTNTKATVYCLVRESPGMTPKDRVEKSLRQFGIFGSAEEAQELEKKIEWRVVPIKGDITLVHLGMTEDDYAYMSYEIDTVIHAAATVNLIYPYRALHSSNVLGTENVLNFAQENKIKPVHHISTDAVFPPGLIYCSENSDMSQYADQLTSGYSQSKWVAEQLVFRAKERGHPVSIYRCGNVAGPQDVASWNPVDFTLLMLQGCIHSLTAPDIQWQIELTPVDFISKIIVTMVQDLMQSIGKVFHLVNTNTMDCETLWQLLRVQGYDISIVPYEKWYETIKTMSQDNSNKMASSLRALVYLLDNLVKDSTFFSNMTTFTQDNLQPLLKLHNMEYPPVNAELMRVYLRHLARLNFIPLPLRKRKDTAQLLHGQVALVTGASSGIGAAIAEHLAVAGAKVAIAARRMDRLQNLQKQIEGQGGMAICVEMDVCDADTVNKGVEYIENLLGPIDILINNAGIMYYTLMKNIRLNDWQHMVNVNVNGTLNCLAAVLGGMVERKQGHIVNITSDAGKKAFPGLAVYSGTKFFLEGMSQALRQELVDTGIKVTCIQPGDVRTELQSHSEDKEAQEIYDMSAKTKILEPNDVAQVVMFVVTQPGYCAINEILVEPRESPI